MWDKCGNESMVTLKYPFSNCNHVHIRYQEKKRPIGDRSSIMFAISL